jgi:hypothetical protein
MEKTNLIVLDFNTSSVHIYNSVTYTEDIDSLLKELNHNIDEVSYMWSDNLNIEFKQL